MGQKFFAVDNQVGMLHEILKQHKFFQRQRNRGVALRDDVLACFERDVSGGEDRRLRLGRPARKRRNASAQFLEGKRLDQIIISAGEQKLDLHINLISSGQDKHGRGDAGVAHASAN